MMRVMSAVIAVICAVMIMLTWNTALAVAWTVALAGWVPHMFNNHKESVYGNQA